MTTTSSQISFQYPHQTSPETTSLIFQQFSLVFSIRKDKKKLQSHRSIQLNFTRKSLETILFRPHRQIEKFSVVFLYYWQFNTCFFPFTFLVLFFVYYSLNMKFKICKLITTLFGIHFHSVMQEWKKAKTVDNSKLFSFLSKCCCYVFFCYIFCAIFPVSQIICFTDN